MLKGPPIVAGRRLDFMSVEAFVACVQQEMAANRFSAIGFTEALFSRVEFNVFVASQAYGRVECLAVQTFGDLTGFQVENTEWNPMAKRILEVAGQATVKNTVATGTKAPQTDSGETEAVVPRSTAAPERVDTCSKVQVHEQRSASMSVTDKTDRIYGGLVDEDYTPPSDTERRQASSAKLERSSGNVSKSSSSTVFDKPMARNDSEAGMFSVFRAVGEVDASTLFAFLLSKQIQCVQGQLTLMTSTTVVGLSLDGSGCLAIESPHDGIGNPSFGAAQDVNARRTQGPQKVLSTLVESLVRLSEEAINYRFRRCAIELMGGGVPCTVYAPILLLTLLKSVQLDKLRAVYEENLEHFVVPRSAGSLTFKDFQFERRNLRFFEIIDAEEHSLRRLLQVSPLNRGATYRILKVGQILGLVEFSSEKRQVVDYADEHFDYLETTLSKAEQGLFEALGVHMVTHPRTYGDALARIESQFAQDSVYAAHSEKHRRLCRQIIELAKQAKLQLSNKVQRVAYRKANIAASEMSQAADVLLEQADMHRLRGDDRAMRDALEMALELDPLQTRAHVLQQRHVDTIDLDQLS